MVVLFSVISESIKKERKTKFSNCGCVKPQILVLTLWALYVTGDKKKQKHPVLQLIFQGKDSQSPQGNRKSTTTWERSSFGDNGSVQEESKEIPTGGNHNKN